MTPSSRNAVGAICTKSPETRAVSSSIRRFPQRKRLDKGDFKSAVYTNFTTRALRDLNADGDDRPVNGRRDFTIQVDWLAILDRNNDFSALASQDSSRNESDTRKNNCLLRSPDLVFKKPTNFQPVTR
jgi:hypothetical protein